MRFIGPRPRCSSVRCGRMQPTLVRLRMPGTSSPRPRHSRTRMYRSLREIVDGWSKNLALGAPLMMPPVSALRSALPYLIWLPVCAWVGPPLAWLIWRWDAAALATAASLLTWLGVYGV